MLNEKSDTASILKAFLKELRTNEEFPHEITLFEECLDYFSSYKVFYWSI